MHDIIDLFMSNPFFWLAVVSLIAGLISQSWVNSSLKKYQQVPSSCGITGYEAAQRMLSFYNISGVRVCQGKEGQDYYDPRNRSVCLSPSVFNGVSVTSLAVICHEVGHACQHAEGAFFNRLRTALVPIVNLGASSWFIALFIGIMFQLSGLVILAALLYSLVLVFSLITLPVEFDASHRAITYMKTINLPEDEIRGSKRVLRSCAFTYVVAVLVSALQLIAILSRR